MTDCPCEHFCSFNMLPSHTSWATSQSHKTCMTDSGKLVQFRQILSSTTHRLVRFRRVGRISWHAFHPKTLILLGIQSFHKAAHTCFPTQPLKFSIQSSLLRTYVATLYADFTENSPFLLWSQIIASGTYLRLKGILQFASTSSLWNMDMIKSHLHQCKFGSIRSETNKSFVSSLVEYRILCVGWFGIHLCH